MKKFIIITLLLVSFTAHAVSVIPMPEQRSFFDKVILSIKTCGLNVKCYFQPQKLGVSYTTIWATTTIASYPTIHNANMKALNDGKIENATTSIQSLTTASNLATVGNLTAGAWQANTLQSLYGGTGTTSMSQYRVLLGNGTGSTTVATSTGSVGQVLTSSGEGKNPFWGTYAVNEAGDYDWTGAETHASSTITKALLTNATSTTFGILGSFNLNGLGYRAPSVQGASSTVMTTDASGNIVWDYTDWQLLGEVIATSSQSALNLNNFPARENLKVVGYITGRSALYPQDLTFNNDIGANYNSRTYQSFIGLSSYPAFTAFRFMDTGSTTSAYFEMEIGNGASTTSSFPKIIKGSITNGDGALFPTRNDFYGTYSGGTAQITTISFIGQGQFTFTSGTRFQVFGTRK